MLKYKALNKKKEQFYNSFQEDKGFGLVSVCLIILVLGISAVSALSMYEHWRDQKVSTETADKMQEIQEAVLNFVSRPNNGRYPCPAPLDSAPDTAAFGMEVGADCTAAPLGTGTFRGVGPDGENIRIGAVPVRALGLPDDYIVDGWGHRFVFAVTESQAIGGADLSGDGGDIVLQDMAGNDATIAPGNIPQLTLSLGADDNGAFDMMGNVISPCNAAAVSGVNCDFLLVATPPADAATFTNTLDKMQADENNTFVHHVAYTAPRTVTVCDPGDPNAVPKDMSILLDTSGSMTSRDVTCTSTLTPGNNGKCTRMETAHWALRRIIPARIKSNSVHTDPGKTNFSGFLGGNSINAVANNLNNKDISFDDPDSNGYVAPTEEDALADLEAQLSNMCGNGGTPLGAHMRALGDDLGNGDQEQIDLGRPNKIVIISDGHNNGGPTPQSILNDFKADLSNVQIDVIYMGPPNQSHEDEMRTVTSGTGGEYFSAEDPDALLEALGNSILGCTPAVQPNVNDQDHC